MKACHILYSHGYSFPYIGKLLNRDHTSVMDATSTIEHRIKYEVPYIIVWEAVKHLHEHDPLKEAYNYKFMRKKPKITVVYSSKIP